MLKPAAFFDSSQWPADQARNWLSLGLTLTLSEEAHLGLGPPDAIGFDDFVHGAGRAWRFTASCGLQLIVLEAFQVLKHQGEQVLSTVLVTPFRAEANHALQHLSVDAQVADDNTLELDSGWELSRLDDNGQQFVIGYYPRRASAECVGSLLGAGKHKQTYSLRLVEPLPVMISDVGEWELWRRDDAGSAFLVTRHLTRHHAQMQLDALEAEPRHKQVYWLEHRPRKADGGAHR